MPLDFRPNAVRHLAAPAWLPAVALLVITGGGCDAGTEAMFVERPDPARVSVRNDSQYDIEEIRFHHFNLYGDSPNLLPVDTLAVDDHIEVVGIGDWYVTFLREKNRGGEILAYTTAWPIRLEWETTYILELFDTSFRFTPGSVEPSLHPQVDLSTISGALTPEQRRD